MRCRRHFDLFPPHYLPLSCPTHSAEAYNLLARQQQLEAMLAEVKGQKPPELLLESAEGLLARMRAKLQKTG